MDHGQHFTFCCLGYSDLNSDFKEPSNTFLTPGKPHKSKHTLSTLSSKHVMESMHRAKNDNSEPRIHLTGNSEFS